MKNNQLPKELDKARINIYNILAILIVIIPEFFAEIIYSLGDSQYNNKLPIQGEAWENNKELKLSRMTIYELRLIAQKISIYGYSNENRTSLIKRILRKSNKRNRWK